MKTNYISRIGLFAVAFALLSMGVKAQTHSNYIEFKDDATVKESIDTVTVGSRMPYFVEPQTAVTGLGFEYQWTFSATGLTILKYDGTGNATAGTGANFYKENEISVKMPSTAGAITVKTNVQSLAGTTVLCSGTEATNNIQVVPVPTMAWKSTEAMKQCTPVSADIPIDIQLTGYGQWMVNYSIVKSDFDGTNPVAAVNKTDVAIGANGNAVGATATDFALNIPEAEFANVGLYTIEVTKLTDRISRKSLDVVAGTLPTTKFQIFVYPTPVTKPLQHVKNMQ
jgi:hypothetical protein